MNTEFDIVKQNLTPEDIIHIVTETLGAHNYIEKDEYILFPTICHNINANDSKMKLYYYKESKLFHCYTECGETFDIFGLFKRYYQLRKIKYNFYVDILYKIIDKNQIITNFDSNIKYESQSQKYKIRNNNIILPVYSEGVLEIFSKQYPIEWIFEKISPSTMDKFKIRFSTLENKIIIPHYDINNNLVGIRARSLNPYDIENFGKYAPIKVEDQWYSHPLSLNLYGINFNKEAIQKNHKVVLVEGEKGIYLYEEFFGNENNIALAVCGSNFNKFQLKLLLKNFDINEIIIAFDKEYQIFPSKESEKYFNKLYSIGKKYNNYCDFSFIYDTKGLLKEKQSPLDAGKEKYEKLFKERIQIK